MTKRSPFDIPNPNTASGKFEGGEGLEILEEYRSNERDCLCACLFHEGMLQELEAVSPQKHEVKSGTVLARDSTATL